MGITAEETTAANTGTAPSGAATSANQSSQITQETAIAAATGTQSDSAATNSTGSWSVISLLKGLYNLLTGNLKTSSSGYTYTDITTKTTTNITCTVFYGYIVTNIGTSSTVRFQDNGTDIGSSTPMPISGTSPQVYVLNCIITSGTLNVITGGTTMGSITIVTK